MEDDELRGIKHHSWPTPTAMNDHHTQQQYINVYPHHKQPTPLYPHEHSKLRRFSQRFSASSSSYASYSSALAAAATAAAASTTSAPGSTTHQQRPSQYQQHHNYHHFQYQQHQHFQHQSSEDPYSLRTRPHQHNQHQRTSLGALGSGAGASALLGSDAAHLQRQRQQQSLQQHPYPRRTSAIASSTTTAVLDKCIQSYPPPATCVLGGSTPPSPLSSPLAIRMPTSSCSCPSPSALSPLSPSSPIMEPAPTMTTALSSSSSSSSSLSSSASTAMVLCSPVMTVVSTLSQDSSPDSSASSRCSSRTSSTSPPPGRSRKASPLPSLSYQTQYQTQHLQQHQTQQKKPPLGPRSGSLEEPGPLSFLPVVGSATGDGVCTSFLSSCSAPLSSAASLPLSERKKSGGFGCHGHAPTASISTTRSITSSTSSVSSGRQYDRVSTATTSLTHSSRSSSPSTARMEAATAKSRSMSPSQQARASYSHQYPQRRKRQQYHASTQHLPLQKQQQPIISPQAIAQNSTKYICFLFWPLLPLLILAIGGQTSAFFESPEKNGHLSSTATLRHRADFVGHVRARKQPPAPLLEGHQLQHHYKYQDQYNRRFMPEPTNTICSLETWLFVEQFADPQLPKCVPEGKRIRARIGASSGSSNPEKQQLSYERRPFPELHQPWDRESCGCAISGFHLLSLLSWDMLKPGYSWKQHSLAVGCRNGSRGGDGRVDGDVETSGAGSVSISNPIILWIDMMEQVVGTIYELPRWKSRDRLASLMDTTMSKKEQVHRRLRSAAATASPVSKIGERGFVVDGAAEHERQMLGRYLFRIAFVLGLLLLGMAIHETFFAQVEMPSYTRA